MQDHRLALPTLLSRLAALQGFAVPAHRFSMLQQGREGVELSSLPGILQAMEMWRSRFPAVVMEECAADRLQAGDFPLLWIDTADQRPPLLVRGRLSQGHFSVEEAQGNPQVLASTALSNGSFLRLQVDPAARSPDQQGQRSASEWFMLALQRHRRIFLEGVLGTFTISVLGLVAALYTMQVYDRVVPTSGYATLWVLTVGVLLAVLLEFTMKQVRVHMVDRAAKAIDLELSAVFFGKALHIRMDARPSTVGTFASQIRHFESVRNFLTASTLFILADAPFALFFIGVIYLIAGPVALVPAIMIPIALLSGLMFRGAIERHTQEHMEESNRKNGLLIEAVDGIESVKATGGEWKMLDRYQSLSATIATSELKLKELSNRATHLAQGIQQLNYVGLIAVGAYAITQGQLTMGGLIACSIIAGRALNPMAQIPTLIVQWKHAKIALKALDQIMAMPSDRDARDRVIVPEHCRGQLQVEHVNFAYLQEQSALDLESLSLQPGERVAVIGPVGSGKSTFIKILSGLYKPTSGKVLLDGVDLQHLAPEFLREHIGYLPQDVRLFNGTLRENLTLGLPTPSDDRILEAAALTGLDKFIRAHPRFLELPIAEGGRGLSGGQRQLVGLTRLLIARPKILLLDEPTASMDAQLEQRVMTFLFREMPKDSVILIVTHKTGMLSLVDRVIVMHAGKILMDGPRDAILERLRAENKRGVPAPGAVTPPSVTPPAQGMPVQGPPGQTARLP
jgi:ATP-binding cassette subfamily C protein LapB